MAKIIEIELGNRLLKIIYIPGHTKGSIPKQYEGSLDKLINLQAEYDWIYASHDEHKLPRDYAEKVKEAWKKVQNSDGEYEIIDLFGNKVKSYITDACGFYMDCFD